MRPFLRPEFPMITDINLRQSDREALAAAVAQYQASGGKIQQLSHVERAPHKPISYNGQIKPKARDTAAFKEEERLLMEHAKALASVGLTSSQAMRQLRKRWTGRAVITTTRLELLAMAGRFQFAEGGK